MIKTFDKDTSKQNLLDALEADGACIIADAIDAELLARLDAEIAAGLSHVTVGQDSFTGHATKRMGALAARFPACRELILNPLTLGAAEDFLKPYCDRIQLHVSQVINIMPGQGAQQLHRDRHAFGNFLPATIEPQFNTMWALTDFTAKNGATHVIPGSHKWLMDKAVERRDSVQAEMRRGSVLLKVVRG